ncbi:hypothetical protein [Modestobacter altitudinis]|uniref:hypothetical protein n=1 Tax=Modestobacter altitudinis TaxID=2213158 RepID=UPI00110CB03B|nr:hypothetical protein [Modestobacter altitudinis]
MEQTPAAASGTAAPATTTAPVTGAPGTSSAEVVSTGAPVATKPPTSVATDPPLTPDPGSDVAVQITYSGWDAATQAVEVDGYVADVAESGGTCTLTLTQGGTSVTASVPANREPSATSCSSARIGRAQLSPGTWAAVLGYDSATSHGQSERAQVVVP